MRKATESGHLQVVLLFESPLKSGIMGSSKQLSNDLKTKIIPHSCSGERYKKLSQRFNLSISTVRNIERKWKNTGYDNPYRLAVLQHVMISSQLIAPRSSLIRWKFALLEFSVLVKNNLVMFGVYELVMTWRIIMAGTAVNGLVNVVISTLEKRYDLNSSLTGLVSASYDIAFCLLSLFVSFYGQRGHKPRWLAFSALMIGIDFCEKSGNNTSQEDCNGKTGSTLSNYLYVFVLGQLLMGVGGTPLYTLGTAFFDDSLPTHKSSLYIGIAYGMSVVGPAIGYLIGGQLLNIYIDFEKVDSVPMYPNDPRWLGAWWIAFLIEQQQYNLKGFHKHITMEVNALLSPKILEKNFKDFPLALLLLIKNPVLMTLTFASCSDALITTGFAAFLPKFIENQFSLTSSFSAILGVIDMLVLRGGLWVGLHLVL
ncbi:unnamed protein product [Ranitomeya imitator]|uniref:Solute carrier organic anion transporter family member n=1 Tax=Ranitomeya imitator TaxID=111125 RepID=A0ABN9MFR5_9NEOB|nr:unnamed protein product [Ranitomeya imitator]